MLGTSVNIVQKTTSKMGQKNQEGCLANIGKSSAQLNIGQKYRQILAIIFLIELL